MVPETFFDLQRFANDVLVGGESGFYWQGGNSFLGEGTKDDPTQWVAAGTSGATATLPLPELYLNGSESGYSFAVSQNKDNWEVAIKGASNIIGGNFSNSTGDYILEGVATVTAYANSTEGFTETVNAQPTYVKADSANVPFQVAADGFDDTGLEYTFNNGVANVTVGVDNDDAAIFSGAATGVVIATGDSFANQTSALGFDAAVTVTTDGEKIVTYTTNDNRITGADGDGAIVIMGDSAPADPVPPGYTAPTGPATITSDGKIESGGHIVAFEASAGFGYSGDTGFGASGVTVNGTVWTQISGGLSKGVAFDANGNAAVDNTAGDAVTVDGSEGSYVGFAHLNTAGVVVNGARIDGFVPATTIATLVGDDDGASDSFAVELAASGSGIKSISFDQDDDIGRIVGTSSTSSYEINVKVSDTVSAKYTLSANTDTLKFDAYNDAAEEAIVFMDDGKEYSISGAAARFYSDNTASNASTTNTINGAQVTINNNNSGNNFEITTNNGQAGDYGTGADGVDVISRLYMGDTVNVDDDDDGYTAIWNPGTDGDYVVGMTADDLNIKANASELSGNVTMKVASSGEAATVSGIASTVVTLDGGTAGKANVYYFNGEAVTVAEGSPVHVTLDSAGNVVDAKTAASEERLAADDNKWAQYATIGSDADTLVVDKSSTYEDFYNLAGGSAAGMSIAGYDKDYYSAGYPVASLDNINIIGESPLGDPKALSEAVHVTLDVNSGTDVGSVPINIEDNESDFVNDVTIDLTGSDKPSTIAIGTTGEGTVTAPHNVLLSSVAGGVAYIGQYATGLNYVQAGAGGAMMRHDGDDYRASIYGGTGNDTIWAAAKDSVKGGDGADVFYDRGTYTIQDYSFSDGDVILATALDSLGDVNYNNVQYTGNKVNLGNKTLTLGNIDPTNNAFIKVKVMDGDGNISTNSQDVILVNEAGTVNAADAGATNALIIADRGLYANMIYGTNTVDSIYASTGDSILSGAGNDHIYLDEAYPGAVVGLVAGSGHDTVYGWSTFNESFNNNENANRLYTGNSNRVDATFYEGNLVVGIGAGDSLTFADTGYAPSYDILVDERKYTIIRKDRFAIANSNDDLAEYYLAQENGTVWLTDGVVNAVRIDLTSDMTKNVRTIILESQGKDTIIGTDARETVVAHASEASGGTKYIYMSGGNDVIYSGGDDGYAGNIIMFGVGDGRDSIHGFNHYKGIDKDPDNQRTDFLVLEDLNSIDVSTYEGDTTLAAGDRIVFNVTDSDDVVIYEEGGLDVNGDMYRLRVNNLNEEGYAKIGYTNQANNFTYDSEVSYYIGSADNHHDTLTIGEEDYNVEVWLDNTGNKFYRGIDVLDASAATNTEVSLAGNKNNNTIIAGGEGTRNSLWGGAGDNLLIGGAGEDLFAYSHKSREYVNGGGEVAEASHDTIQGYTNGVDNIYVDATLADLDLTAMSKIGTDGITDDSVTLVFNNGGTLVVQGDGDTAITMSDGNAYTANRSSKQWEARG